MLRKKKRICNDLAKTCSPNISRRLLEQYYRAREAKENSYFSAKWAMMYMEASMWHQRVLKFESTGWRSNKRINTSRQRFVSLVNSPFNSHLTLEEINSICLSTPFNSSLEAVGMMSLQDKRSTRRSKNIAKALHNYSTIIGEKPHSNAFPFYLDPDQREIWLKFKRGKDLFIFSKFDINKQLQQISLRNETHNPYHIIAMSLGIENKWYLEKIIQTAHLKEYVQRYFSWFRKNNNFNKLDELASSTQYDIDIHLYKPITLFRKIREAKEEYDLLHSSLQKEWPWVCHNFPDIQTEQGVITFINNNTLLQEIGEELDNCAGDYGLRIQKKHCLLAVLHKNNKAIALCEYDEKGKIRQCQAYSHKDPEPKVIELFKKQKVHW